MYLARTFLATTTIALTGMLGHVSAQSNSLFRYELGDPIDRDSTSTSTVISPAPPNTQTDTDNVQGSIDGSTSYSTSVSSSASSQGTISCAAGFSSWTADVQSADCSLSVLPRARYIQFDVVSDGTQQGVLDGSCQMTASTQASADAYLSIPFTLASTTTVKALVMRIDRGADDLVRTGPPDIVTVNSTFSWILYEDTNGNGLVDSGEPIADNGQAQQSISAGFQATTDVSGTYTGQLSSGAYVLSAHYVDNLGAGGSLQQNTQSTWDLSQDVSARFRLEIL